MRNLMPAVRTRRVHCARCDAAYSLAFSANGRSIDAICPACRSPLYSLSDKSTADKRTVQYLPLVYFVVHRDVVPRLTRDRLTSLGGIEELAGEGMLALVDASRCFDSDYRSKTGATATFKTYAMGVIRRRLWLWINRQLANGADGLPYIDSEYWVTGTRPFVCDEDIAMPDRNAPEPPSEAGDREGREMLRNRLRSLPDRLQAVLIGRYWHGNTLAEVARQIGVSKERIRQNEAEAIAMLANLYGQAEPATWRRILLTRKRMEANRSKLKPKFALKPTASPAH